MAGMIPRDTPSQAPEQGLRILITGAKGQLGQILGQRFARLAAQAPAGTPLQVHCLDRSQCDLSREDELRRCLTDLAPQLIINAAAFTAVDQAEQTPELAHAVNARAPAILAEEARRLGAWLVHYSTDYVFAGTGEHAQTEDMPCAPASVYGHSKQLGEQAVQAACPQHLIFRTSWVYDAQGSNFMRTMLRLAADRERLEVIDDQWGAPSWTGRIVAVTEAAVRSLGLPGLAPLDGALYDPPWPQTPLAKLWVPGIYHLCPAGFTTWYRYAARVFELHPDAGRRLRELVPITSRQYEANMQRGDATRKVAPRPHNSRLDCHKLEAALGLPLPAWDEDLAQCLRALRA